MSNNIRFINYINYINKLKSIFPMLLSVFLDLFWSFVGVPTFVG